MGVNNGEKSRKSDPYYLVYSPDDDLSSSEGDNSEHRGENDDDDDEDIDAEVRKCSCHIV